MASKLDAAEKRGDGCTYAWALRLQLDRKMRVAQRRLTLPRNCVPKLLKKDEQIDRLLASGKEAAEVARRLEAELADKIASVFDLQDEVQRSEEELEYYRNHSREQRDTIGRLRSRVNDSEPELRKWQGISVRLNWLIKEMEKVECDPSTRP